ncbi:hypothetical protein GCM10010495_41800 [Kitasatospora herbaricolor]|nr:hypothetical protein GCM10010495_41800 [Kitasatospora herbaricolor]
MASASGARKALSSSSSRPAISREVVTLLTLRSSCLRDRSTIPQVRGATARPAQGSWAYVRPRAPLAAPFGQPPKCGIDSPGRLFKA